MIDAAARSPDFAVGVDEAGAGRLGLRSVDPGSRPTATARRPGARRRAVVCGEHAAAGRLSTAGTATAERSRSWGVGDRRRHRGDTGATRRGHPGGAMALQRKLVAEFIGTLW